MDQRELRKLERNRLTNSTQSMSTAGRQEPGVGRGQKTCQNPYPLRAEHECSWETGAWGRGFLQRKHHLETNTAPQRVDTDTEFSSTAHV